MEIWKDIEGYNGYYQVSNYGRVKSCVRCVERSDGQKRIIKERIKKLTRDKDGYLICSLSKGGKTEKRAVHRIVYTAFVGPIPRGEEINHIDFDRENNTPDNLESVSHIENISHTVTNKRHYTARDLHGDKNPNYGNRKLSKRYKDKELSKQKQARPGTQNGRCVPVVMIEPDGNRTTFGYIGMCALELKRRLCLDVKEVYLSSLISKYAKIGKKYKGYEFILLNADDDVPSFHEND